MNWSAFFGVIAGALLFTSVMLSIENSSTPEKWKVIAMVITFAVGILLFALIAGHA